MGTEVPNGEELVTGVANGGASAELADAPKSGPLLAVEGVSKTEEVMAGGALGAETGSSATLSSSGFAALCSPKSGLVIGSDWGWGATEVSGREGGAGGVETGMAATSGGGSECVADIP